MSQLEHTDLLAYLIKNPSEASQYVFLKEILEKEDYVIYFYIYHNHIRGVGFNREILEMFLRTNANVWVSPRSKLFKEGKMSIDYIKSQTETVLVSKVEIAQAFIQIVLRRYDQIVTEYKDKDMSHSPVAIKEYAEHTIGREVIEEAISIMREGGWDSKLRESYEPKDILRFLRDKVAYVDSLLSNIGGSESYEAEMKDTLVDTALSYGQAFKWNLGQGLYLPSVYKGYMVSLLGMEKVGKTKISLGEIAYSTMREGGNVLLYSAEMSKEVLLANMIVKHIFVETKKKVSIRDTLIITRFHFWFQTHGYESDILDREIERRLKVLKNPDNLEDEDFIPLLTEKEFRRMEDNKTEIDAYNKMSKVKKELILMAYDEIINSNKYGKLYVKMLNEGVFDVDTIVEKTNKFNEENNVDVFILDHAGFTVSSSGRDKYEAITKMYQNAKAIAVNPEHPVASIVINHTDGDTNDAIKKGKDDISSVRAFGTREGNKSADIEYVLYATPEDHREGKVKLGVTVSRNEPAPSQPLTLIADRGVNDFRGISSSKLPYAEGKLVN